MRKKCVSFFSFDLRFFFITFLAVSLHEELKNTMDIFSKTRPKNLKKRQVGIAHLADRVPYRRNPITFLIARFIHSRLVLWNKHPQAHPVAERKSRIHSNGPIQRTKIHSPSCT
jgi:hypothetical protein